MRDEWDAAGEQDAYVFEELGECLTALGGEDEARIYFAKAFAILSKDAWFVENESERLARIEQLGKIEHG